MAEDAEPDYKTEFLALVPSLRAFARSLCGNAAWADDLTQETLMRAWASRSSFEAGTNMRGWLFTILRNSFYTNMRRRRREAEDPDGAHALRMLVAPSQEHTVELQDLRRMLGRLPHEQREALILVGASGFTYQEAAAICGCAVGSVKSRVSRARRTLLNLLEGPGAKHDEPVPDDDEAPPPPQRMERGPPRRPRRRYA